MTKLVWGQPDQRRYEAGVDRGVLYPDDGPGVAWNGLTNVEESFSGGELSSYHFDGIKYLDLVSPKTFQATISAFSAPEEFSRCIGDKSVIPGFILTRQTRSRFGFSYRTLLDERGYKLHLVYNALASPNGKSHQSLKPGTAPETRSWKIDAVPPPSSTYRPSAHFVLDSTQMDPDALAVLEAMLYGSTEETPRLPTIDELIDIVGLWAPLIIIQDPAGGLNQLLPGVRASYNRVIRGVDFAPSLSWTTSVDNPDGSWMGTVATTVDPQMNAPISIERLEDRRFIRLRFSVDGDAMPGDPPFGIPGRPNADDKAQLFYAINGGIMLGTQRFNLTPVRDGVMRDYILEPATMTGDDLDKALAWLDPANTITELRFDPVDVVPGPTAVTVESVSVGGLSNDISIVGDLYRTKVGGILRVLPNSRLYKSPINGLYRME